MKSKFLLTTAFTVLLGSPVWLSAQEDPEDLLRQGVEDKTQQDEGNHAAADTHFKTGLRLYQDAVDTQETNPRVDSLNNAREQLLQALAYNPGHKEARKLLTKVNSALGQVDDRAVDLARREAAKRRAFIAQQEMDIQSRYLKASNYLDDENYSMAIQEAEATLKAIDFLPFDSNVSKYKTQLENLIEDAKRQREIAAQKRKISAMEQAKTIAQNQLEREKVFRRRRLHQLFEEAAMRHEAHDYQRALALYDQILLIDPGNAKAKKFKDNTKSHLERQMIHDVKKDKQMNLEATQLWNDEIYVIYNIDQIVHFPDDYAAKVVRRKEDAALSRDQAEEDWKTRLRVTLNRPADRVFEEEPLSQVIGTLMRVYDVVILPDPSIDLDQPVTIPTSGQNFGMVLDILVNNLQEDGMNWTLRNGAIYISQSDGQDEDNVIVYYDVRDLIGLLKDFIGPEISLAAGDDGGSITIEETDSETDDNISGDGLVDLISNSIEAESWDDTHTIEIRNGQIVVNHRPVVQEKIQDLLSFMRSQRALQVSIQTRFLRATDTDFDHLGVNWTGIASPLNDDVLDSKILTGPFAGTLGSNFQPINSLGFVNGSNTSTMLMRGLTQSYVGNGWTVPGEGTLNQGGALEFDFLNDNQVAALLQAVHLNTKSTVLVAPMVTCFNTQRANISVLAQQAYIRDLTAVVQVNIGIFDPDIGYVQSGTTLDVRPIVSHDRKYITLELRPTVATLDAMPQMTVPSGLAGAANIDLPTLTFRAARTTVSVPDNGSLLIGGYSTGTEVDEVAGIPFLNQIPIINTLTGRAARSRTSVNDYILVKAQIVDQSEIEMDIFGKID